jgi:hypothetical protein
MRWQSTVQYMQPKAKADDEGSMAQRVSSRGPVAESSGLGGVRLRVV